MKKVILVFKTHFDIGFTDLASNVISQYAGPMLSQVLETCRATKDMGKLKYVWTMPAWPLHVVTRECSAKMKEELDYYIKNGQVVWHGLPFTSHTDFCGEEEYLEGLRYGRMLSDQYQKPYPIAAKMTDVPGHGWMLPEVLAASGIRFLHLGCNAFATPPRVPDLFYWQTPSGRKLLTMYGKGGYGSGLETPENWDYPVWMALIHTHDNCGPHSAGFIRELELEARQLYPEAEIVCGTMDDFCRELEQCDLSKVPVVKEDLADSWIHGIGAYPREVSMIREMRHESTNLQKQLWAEDPARLQEPEIAELLDTYYENMHLFGEHTWGADVKTWLGPNRVYKKEAFAKERQSASYQFMEQSWKEQRERAGHCRQALDKLAAAAGLLQESLKQGEMTGGADLIIHSNGEISWVENHRYRLEFQPDTGKIKCLRDKKLQCELLKEQGAVGVFSYQYTRHGIQKMTEFLRNYGYRYSTWGIQDYGREEYPECQDEQYQPAFQELRVAGDTISFCYQGGYSAKAYGDAREIQVKITLPSAGEELFVELSLIGKQETAYLESGSFCMPLLETQREYWVNKNGVVLNPRTDICEQANHVYYAIEEFAASDDGRHGICVMPKDTPLLSIGEDGMYQYRKAYQEREQILFFNAFNNMWGTNFPQWQGGDYHYRFVLWGYEAAAERAQLYQQSIRLANGRFLSKPLDTAGIILPESLQLLNIKQEQEYTVLITRDLSGKAGLEQINAPGFQIGETDYFGRVQGESKEHCLPFQKLAYGLHLFRLKK